jgi:hypothetical protein
MNGLIALLSNQFVGSFSFASLSIVNGKLSLSDNLSLTYVYLPKLTYINGAIVICGNNEAFMVPSGPPNAPSGGLLVTGADKGKPLCRLQDGASSCLSMDETPGDDASGAVSAEPINCP